MREWDDHYFSLKENQYLTSKMSLDHDILDELKVSENERKTKVYTEKYLINLDKCEDYAVLTQNLRKFILEIN